MYMYEEKGNKIKKLLLPVLDHAEPYVRKEKERKRSGTQEEGKKLFPNLDHRSPPPPFSLALSLSLLASESHQFTRASPHT